MGGKMILAFRALAAVALFAPLLMATEASAQRTRREDPSASGNVVRGSARDISYADIRSMANEVLADIFFTSNVLSRGARNPEAQPFRVVVRHVENRTSSDRISTDQFLRILEEELLRTGIVELYTADSADWEYVIDATLDSTTARDGRTTQIIYNLSVEMASNDNRRLGIWSSELQLTQRR